MGKFFSQIASLQPKPTGNSGRGNMVKLL